MTDEKKNMGLVGVFAAAAVGLLFIGQQQMAKTAGDNTANLPATNERVKTNAQTILRNQENARADLDKLAKSFRDDLDKLNERLADSIKSNAQNSRADLDKLNESLSDQINRREVEQVKYIDGLDAKVAERIAEIKRELSHLSNRFDNHQNNPPATHQHGNHEK